MPSAELSKEPFQSLLETTLARWSKIYEDLLGQREPEVVAMERSFRWLAKVRQDLNSVHESKATPRNSCRFRLAGS